MIEYIPINWHLIGNPINWAIILLMVLIAGFALHLVLPTVFPSLTPNTDKG